MLRSWIKFARTGSLKMKLKRLLGLFGVLSACTYIICVALHRSSDVMLRTRRAASTDPPTTETSFIYDNPTVEPSRTLAVADPDLVIFVQSAHTRFHERHRVRQTWARTSIYVNTTVVVFFTIGRSSNVTTEQDHQLRDEISAHGDILLQEFHDTYDNLTLKGLLTMRWIAQKLSKSAYVIKTDDDILLDVFLWIRMMNALDDRQVTCGVLGLVWINSPVIRVEDDAKHGVTNDQYARTHYPSFCSGSGYLMTPDAFRAILAAADHVPLFVRDDPYFTGILTQALDIPLLTFPYVHLKFFDKNLLIPEIFRGPPLIVHGLSDAMWTFVWDSVRLGEKYGRTNSMIEVSSIKASEKGEKLDPLSDVVKKRITSRARCVPATDKQMHISVGVRR